MIRCIRYVYTSLSAIWFVLSNRGGLSLLAALAFAACTSETTLQQDAHDTDAAVPAYDDEPLVGHHVDDGVVDVVGLKCDALVIPGGASARPGFQKYAAWHDFWCRESHATPTKTWFDCRVQHSNTPNLEAWWGYDVQIRADGSWKVRVVVGPSALDRYVPWDNGTCDKNYCTFSKEPVNPVLPFT